MKKKCALIFINSLLLLNSGTTTAVDNLHFTGNLISKSCTPVINGSQLAEVHFPAIAASDLMNIGQSERVPLVIQLKDCQSSTSLSVRVTLTGTEDSELPGFLLLTPRLLRPALGLELKQRQVYQCQSTIQQASRSR